MIYSRLYIENSNTIVPGSLQRWDLKRLRPWYPTARDSNPFPAVRPSHAVPGKVLPLGRSCEVPLDRPTLSLAKCFPSAGLVRSCFNSSTQRIVRGTISGYFHLSLLLFLDEYCTGRTTALEAKGSKEHNNSNRILNCNKYYLRTEILSNSLFLLTVPANNNNIIKKHKKKNKQDQILGSYATAATTTTAKEEDETPC